MVILIVASHASAKPELRTLGQARKPERALASTHTQSCNPIRHGLTHSNRRHCGVCNHSPEVHSSAESDASSQYISRRTLGLSAASVALFVSIT